MKGHFCLFPLLLYIRRNSCQFLGFFLLFSFQKVPLLLAMSPFGDLQAISCVLSSFVLFVSPSFSF